MIILDTAPICLTIFAFERSFRQFILNIVCLVYKLIVHKDICSVRDFKLSCVSQKERKTGNYILTEGKLMY